MCPPISLCVCHYLMPMLTRVVELCEHAEARDATSSNGQTSQAVAVHRQTRSAPVLIRTAPHEKIPRVSVRTVDSRDILLATVPTSNCVHSCILSLPRMFLFTRAYRSFSYSIPLKIRLTTSANTCRRLRTNKKSLRSLIYIHSGAQKSLDPHSPPGRKAGEKARNVSRP